MNRSIIFIISLALSSSFISANDDKDQQKSFTVKVKHHNSAKKWSAKESTLLKHLKGFRPAPLKLSKYGAALPLVFSGLSKPIQAG